MKKSELITVYAKRAQVSRKEAAQSVHALLEIMAQALEQGESVQIEGFGKFDVRERAAKIVREPFGHTHVRVPPYRTVFFCAGSTLKRRVRETQRKLVK